MADRLANHPHCTHGVRLGLICNDCLSVTSGRPLAFIVWSRLDGTCGQSTSDTHVEAPLSASSLADPSVQP